MSAYMKFIQSKSRQKDHDGLAVRSIDSLLYDFQRHLVDVALRAGRYCIFADCGLGKTLMQIEWAKHVSSMRGPVLIFAPIAVAEQTINEAKKLGVDIHHSRDGNTIDGINITNYEKIHKFSPDGLSGVVLDESSILKAYAGKTKQQIIDFASGVRFRLACTATPAPNDYEEIGNHAEFVGSMRRVEMLATFFSHDGGDTSKWSLKGHGAGAFWKWMSSWSCAIKNPSDIGFDGSRFVLPSLKMHNHIVDCAATGDRLFCNRALTLQDRRSARRNSINERVSLAAEIGSGSDPFIAWCNLNDEGAELTARITGAVEVAGRHDEEHKENAILGFSSGQIRAMVTKPSIAGHGMNWQHCNRMAFVGLSDSYEEMYQAIRRCWRYGQKRPVDAHIIISEAEGEVLQNIQRKERQASEMFGEMVRNYGAEYSASTSYSASEKMRLPKFMEGVR